MPPPPPQPAQTHRTARSTAAVLDLMSQAGRRNPCQNSSTQHEIFFAKRWIFQYLKEEIHIFSVNLTVVREVPRLYIATSPSRVHTNCGNVLVVSECG